MSWFDWADFIFSYVFHEIEELRTFAQMSNVKVLLVDLLPPIDAY